MGTSHRHCMAPMALHGRVQFHDFGGHNREWSHHALVLMSDEVAVVHKLAGSTGEPSGDADDLPRIKWRNGFSRANPYGIFSTPLVWVDNTMLLKRDRSVGATLARIEPGDIVHISVQHLEFDEVHVHRMSDGGPYKGWQPVSG